MHSQLEMKRVLVFIVVIAAAYGCSKMPAGAEQAADRDVAVLEALLKDQCKRAEGKYRVISDMPAEAANTELIPGAWADGRTSFAHELLRRSRENWKWPKVEVCDDARITDASAIDATFARDNRIPPGWEFFYQAYPGAGGLVKFSRPAFTEDGTTAVVYADARCEIGCQARYFQQLKIAGAEWRLVTREFLGTP